MAILLKGFAGSGGSLDRQEKITDLALADLQRKVGNLKVTAIGLIESDKGVTVIAAVEEAVSENKGGKSK